MKNLSKENTLTICSEISPFKFLFPEWVINSIEGQIRESFLTNPLQAQSIEGDRTFSSISTAELGSLKVAAFLSSVSTLTIITSSQPGQAIDCSILQLERPSSHASETSWPSLPPEHLRLVSISTLEAPRRLQTSVQIRANHHSSLTCEQDKYSWSNAWLSGPKKANQTL
jgi:hypothetical protein